MSRDRRGRARDDQTTTHMVTPLHALGATAMAHRAQIHRFRSRWTLEARALCRCLKRRQETTTVYTDRSTTQNRGDGFFPENRDRVHAKRNDLL